jgi:hypothetical protein
MDLGVKLLNPGLQDILVGNTFLAMVGIPPFLPSRELSFEDFSGLFFEKSVGSHSKRGPSPPFWREKGAPAKFVLSLCAKKCVLVFLAGLRLVVIFMRWSKYIKNA